MIVIFRPPVDVEPDLAWLDPDPSGGIPWSPPLFRPPREVVEPRPVSPPPCLSPWQCICGLPPEIHYQYHGPAIISGDPKHSPGLAAGVRFEAIVIGAYGPELFTVAAVDAPAPANLDEMRTISDRLPQPDFGGDPAAVSAVGVLAAGDIMAAIAGDNRLVHLGPPIGAEPGPAADSTVTPVDEGPKVFGVDYGLGDLRPVPPGSPVVHDGRIEVVKFEPVTFSAPIVLTREGGTVSPSAARMKDEMIAVVRAYSAADPRTLQREIGPSEIGDPCDARVLRTSLGFPPVAFPDPWASFVGTAVHARLADAFEAANRSLGVERYVTERRVYMTDGIFGTTDLFDSGDVIDHKILGTDSHREIRLRGFENNGKYSVQLDLYALGWRRAGVDVRTVSLAVWPRSGFLDGLHIEQRAPDFDQAERALDRLSTLTQLGVVSAADESDTPWTDGLISTAPGKGCGFCPFYAPLLEKTRFTCPDGREFQSDKGKGRGPRGGQA